VNTKKTRTDQELIQQSIQGDQEAFGDLYQRYLDQIYRYVFYRVQTVEEAEDLTEATFIRVWEDLRARKTKPAIQNFRAWVYRVAHNQVVDHYRKKRPDQLDMDAGSTTIQSPGPGTEKAVFDKIDSHLLAEAIRQLEETAQNVIILRFLNGLSHAETAEALNLNEGHVRVIQYRALKHLQAILKKDHDD
jgi:RNA polymerase sigma-70 factor (ECF subfamily)